MKKILILLFYLLLSSQGWAEYPTNAKNLLHFDGNFNDEISTRTWAAYAGAIATTTQAKFGTGSLYCDGTGDYIYQAIPEYFPMGIKDYTIECWVYPLSTTGYKYTSWAYQNLGLSVQGSSNVTVDYLTGGFYRVVSGTSTVALNTWSHLAVSRNYSAGWVKLFVNGICETSSVLVDNNDADSGSILAIGGVSGMTTYSFNGYIDEYLLTTSAKYSGSFTPPTSPYSNVQFATIFFSPGGTINFAPSGMLDFSRIME